MLKHNGHRVLSVKWWDAFGIVKTVAEVDGHTYFFAGSGGGMDEEADTKHIIDWGRKYTRNQFMEFYEVMFAVSKGEIGHE